LTQKVNLRTLTKNKGDHMTTLNSLLTDATQLPLAERIELIEALWETVPEEALPPLSEEWMAEIERRSAEFKAGIAKTTPWETVHAEALERLQKKTHSSQGG
jgi:putative addiction module component (TIGR02574 family)